MDFEEHEEDLSMPPPSYDDSVPNPSRVKMPSHAQQEGEAAASATMAAPYPAARNSGKGRYRECLKNHALAIGGHALDGCCEFMAAGADGTLDALKCAACNCHRNFHRKETDPLPAAGDSFLLPSHHHHHHNPFNNRHHQPFPQFAPCYRAQGAGYLHVAGQQRGGGAGAAALALPSISGAGGGTTQSTRDEHEDVSEPSGGGGGGGGGVDGGGSSKKRFRTKFTQEQKEKMLGFAERVGWRIQKHDEVAVQEFCDQVGVKRHVLKVWMHNNKHTLGKKP